MLTIQEHQYFNNIVKVIIKNLDVKIPIIPEDHDGLKGKNKNASGLIYADENKKPYKITIDDFFISECYNNYLWLNHQGGHPKATAETLTDVICHELAHIIHWRHGKKHTELTQKLIKQNGKY